jgi:ElaB/YqjD/DUF883 family membrane-anchored ribosome-binding protein
MPETTPDMSRPQRSGESILNKDAINQRVSSAKDAASDLFNSGKRKVAEWGEGIEEGVKERPMRSVLIAVGVGFVVGVLVGRR